MKKVLFDEDVPRPLRRDLPELEIRTVVEMGWSGVKNGELLRHAQEVFEAFLTADKNLEFQQSVSKLRLGVVVLTLRNITLDELRPIAPAISAALQAVQPGEVIHVPPI